MRTFATARRLVAASALALLVQSTGALAALEEDINRATGERAPTAVSNLAQLRLEYFEWREWDGDTRLLKEKGPRLQLGLSRKYVGEDITFTPRVEGTFGYVDYDGQTQAGTPVGTDVRYVGFGIGADVGAIYRLKGGTNLEPYVGLGWNYWRRDIRTTDQATGYLETWDRCNGKGGLRGETPLKGGGGALKAYGDLGVRMPLATYNSVKFPGVGRVNVSPKGNVSVYGAVGLRVDRWRCGLFYDSWRFQASDTVSAGLMQPKSRADIYGLEAGYAF